MPRYETVKLIFTGAVLHPQQHGERGCKKFACTVHLARRGSLTDISLLFNRMTCCSNLLSFTKSVHRITKKKKNCFALEIDRIPTFSKSLFLSFLFPKIFATRYEITGISRFSKDLCRKGVARIDQFANSDG